MCNPQTNARINSKQILDILRPQEERIMTLEPFDASAVPFPYPEHQDFKAGSGLPPGMVQSQSPPPVQGTPQPVMIQPNQQQSYYAHFKGYADQSHPQPVAVAQPPQPVYHQQVFQQYSVERPAPQVHTTVIEQPKPQLVTVPPQVVHTSGTNAMNILPNWAATSTTSNVVSHPPVATVATNSYKTTTTTTNTKVEGSQFATSHITQSYQTSNPNSDFLKKIDEQLENSRKQFPS